MSQVLRDRSLSPNVRGWTVIDGGARTPKERPAVVGAVVRGAALAEELRAALAGNPNRGLRSVERASVDLAALRSLAADVVICEVDPSQPAELDVLSQFISDPKAPPVIATAPSLDVSAVCELVHRGIRNVLLQPVKSAELDAVLTHALAPSQPKTGAPPRTSGIVVALLGSSGGVGVTSLAVQGACALSRLKRFRRDTDLCVIDLDVQFGSAALLMDAPQRASIADVVAVPERLDGALLRGAMVRAGGGRFDLLCAPRDLVAIDGIDPEAVGAAIELARSEYALTIIDLPTVWSHWTHAALRAANAIALVTQPTVPSLRQGRRQLRFLEQEELDDVPLSVVLNRVVNTLLGTAGVSLKGAETALDRKVDYVIPELPAMRAAGDAGVALSEVRGGRALETKILELFDGILAAHRTDEPDSVRA